MPEHQSIRNKLKDREKQHFWFWGVFLETLYIRTNDIDGLYKSMLDNKTEIHPNGTLQTKPWGQKEFAILDPDSNLLTFGQNI